MEYRVSRVAQWCGVTRWRRRSARRLRNSMGQILQAALIGGRLHGIKPLRTEARLLRWLLASLAAAVAQSSSAIAASGFERAARGTGSV